MRFAIMLALLLTGCETRTLQSCAASVLLIGPAVVYLRCPPNQEPRNAIGPTP